MINKVLRDRRFGMRFTTGELPSISSTGRAPESFLETDPPDHSRLRRPAAPAFSPKMIDSYRPRVEKLMESLLDNDSMNLVRGLATPLPITMISDLLGIPEQAPVQPTGRIAQHAVPDVHPDIKPDDMVYTVPGAGNRDPRVYPDPNRFGITRSQKPEHLAFASGIHYCLGATLARMEGDVVFRALARKWPDMRQAGPAAFREPVVIRGLASLPVNRS